MKKTILQSLLLALLLLAGSANAWAKVIYLKPNSNWTQANARFAAYCWGSKGNFWYEMCDGNGDGVYTAIVDDSSYSNLIFCRINPGGTGNNWESTWNQTSDLTIPTDGKNLYTIAAGAWSKGFGSWSTANHTKAMYLQPNANWIADNARFAVYCFNGNSNGWISMDMHIASCDLPYYKCDFPVDYKEVIFGRMKPGSTNGWTASTQIWNRTKNLTVLADKDCFAIKEGDWGDENTGADGQWSTFATPSYTITLKADAHGTYNVTYGSTTVTSQLDKDVELTVPFDTKIKITTNTANAGYEQTHGAYIQLGNQTPEVAALDTEYAICGTTTIKGNFVTTEAQQVYLQPTSLWNAAGTAEVYRACLTHDTGEEWVDATPVPVKMTDGRTYDSGDNVQEYAFTIPAGYHSIVFCHVKNNTVSSLTSANLSYRTKALSIPIGQAKNCCKITTKASKTCESIWKVRTFDVNIYASSFGEYGFVYEDTKYFSPESGNKIYEVPQGATVKIFSTPYSEAFDGYVMTNIGGERDELLPGSFLTISSQTNLDDNYKTNKSFMVYLATPVGQSWDNKTGKTPYLYAYHNRTENNQGQVVKMDFVATQNAHHYYRCVIPEGCNTIRFEKRSSKDSYTSNDDLRSVDLRYQIAINSINCYRLSGVDKDPTRTDSLHYEGLWESTPGFYSDWRLVHKKSQGVEYPSDIVRSGTESQIVSLHIDPTNAGNVYPRLVLQMNDGNGKWVGKDSILVKDIRTITGDRYDGGRGVWDFVVKNSGNTMNVDYEAAKRYTGDYYIRTNNAEGAWRFYTLSTNKMTYSSYAKANSGYTHYYCRWVGIVANSTLPGKNNNVKFIVANEHSAVISNELAGDDYTQAGGVLPESANVRWTWDERTNEVKRAYIMSSENDHLMLTYKPNTTSSEQTKKLSDKQNWIYETELEDVGAGSEIVALSAQYPSSEKIQVFLQGKDMITSGNNNRHKVRVMYDFKTNQTSLMLIPDQSEAEVGIDVLIERIDQTDATMVSSPISSASDDGYTLYAAMTFTKDHIMSASNTDWEKRYYWISFPFDVRISDVFGFGEYGKQWIIQYYDGAERAKKGYYLESPTYWRWISDTTYIAGKDLEDANGNPQNGVLKANRGYMLVLAKSLTQQGVFDNVDYVRLYFPSMHKIQNIDGNMQPVTDLLKAYTCTISGREPYDSHWHMIGIPSYANADVEVTQEDLFYYYDYDAKTNSYNVQSAGNVAFKSLHSYMVQYAGDIVWNATDKFVPEQLVARRHSNYQPKAYNMELQLLRADQLQDQTYVRLQEEDAAVAFDMNLDLTKIINSGANIYSLAGENRVELAGNVMPVEDVVVPLGVVISQTDEYTFHMPTSMANMVVELIDYDINTRTNLTLNDYTVLISEGKHHDRFALSLKQNHVATDATSVEKDMTTGAQKYLINGQLIIQRDGQWYNAMGSEL